MKTINIRTDQVSRTRNQPNKQTNQHIQMHCGKMRARRCEISVSLREQMLFGISFSLFLFRLRARTSEQVRARARNNNHKNNNNNIILSALRTSLAHFKNLFPCKHQISFGCLHILAVFMVQCVI